MFDFRLFLNHFEGIANLKDKLTSELCFNAPKSKNIVFLVQECFTSIPPLYIYKNMRISSYAIEN